jgi:hypothetical protein
MKRIWIVISGLMALAGLAGATELIVNGGFDDPFSVGWQETCYSGAGSFLFERSDTLGPPAPGFAARVRKDLGYFACLHQTVDVPDVNLTFSFEGRLRIGGGSSTCWPVSAVILRYLAGAGAELGNTKFWVHTEFATWLSSDTAHLIEVNTPEVWTPFTLGIAQELAVKLPGVNPAAVEKIRVELYAYDNGT